MPTHLNAALLAAALLALPAPAPAADAPYASTYRPIASGPVLIRNATVLTGSGERLDGADVLMRDGRIEAVGAGLAAGDASVVDGSGKWVTPGIIDVHSHLGVYPSPGVGAHQDGNEMTNPVTPNVWAEHAVWPHARPHRMLGPDVGPSMRCGRRTPASPPPWPAASRR